MKGIVIWAQSSCRSVMDFYREFGKALGVPVCVAVWYYKKSANEKDNRNAVGFEDSEFSDMDIVPVGEDFDKGLKVIDSHKGWHHLCCNYQGSENFRRLLLLVSKRGEKVAVGSESPCNMQHGLRGLLKEIYYRVKLPRVVSDVIVASTFFINFSGDDDRLARVVGWPKEKIIPFGYFPPPIPGSRIQKRISNSPFEILSTGEMTWHRGSDVLLDALVLLKKSGCKFHATITQRGRLFADLQAKARRHDLPVDFPGFLDLKDLCRIYESCTVFVGAGRREPWGMRLNDALNCGAPLVVSRGMGGVKMVDDYGCGLSFENENSQDLAAKLQLLATDGDVYLQCAENAIGAARANSAAVKARELISTIERGFPEWLK